MDAAPEWLIARFAAQISPNRADPIGEVFVDPEVQGATETARRDLYGEHGWPIVPEWTYVETPWGPVLNRVIAWRCASCFEPVGIGEQRCTECAAAFAAAIERVRPTPPWTPPEEIEAKLGVRVWTAMLPARGDDTLDVSRAGPAAGRPFAPSRALYSDALARRARGVADATYLAEFAARYRSEMRVSYVRHRAAWDELLARKRVVLACHCSVAAQCHRVVLAQILVILGARYEGEKTHYR